MAQRERIELEDLGAHNQGGWKPVIPEWAPEISLESPGGKARRLWEGRFSEFNTSRSEILFTGLGGGVAAIETSPYIRRFKDGSEIPSYFDLEREFGQVPELLFLVASLKDSKNVIGLRGLARTYKEQGVKGVVVVLTSLDHERQDHQFYDEENQPILEATLLKDVIEILEDRGYIDGGLVIQPHSLRPVEIGLRSDFPLLPIDAFDFLMEAARLNEIDNPFVMGPDKGRKDEAKRMAVWLKCPVASASKKRARLLDGYPTLFIDQAVLDYIRKNQCNVIAADDEIREGGTLGELGKALDGVANSLTVCVVKPVFAGDEEVTAVDHLNQDIITRVIVTDAVEPLIDVAPIRHKLEVISLQPEISQLVDHLRTNLTRPNDLGWLTNPSQTGTLLKLDLSIERYE